MKNSATRRQAVPIGRDRLTSSKRRKIIRLGQVAGTVDRMTEVQDKDNPSSCLQAAKDEYFTLAIVNNAAEVYESAVFSIFSALEVKVNSLALGQEFSVLNHLASTLPAHVFEHFLKGYSEGHA